MSHFINFRLILSCLLFGLAIPVQATQIAGVKLEETIRIHNQDLKLNGAGIRYKGFFKVYVAGLYLADKKTTVQDVLAAPGAKRTVMVLLTDLSSEEGARAMISGMQQNLDRAERTRIASQLVKLGELYAATPYLKKGDVLVNDWIPGKGTVMYMNGKQMGDVFPDPLFYQALLKLWLGEKPADASLKPLLLGQQPEQNNSGNARY